MYQFKELDLSQTGIHQCSEFLFPILRKSPKTFDYLNWEYNENPLGKALGFNAFHENQLVAHYVTQPIKAILEGKEAKGLLALHVATHPNHRNKKLFLKINNLTHEYARGQGYQFVIGIANNKSTHGYVNRLDFQSVTPLNVKIGLAGIKFRSNNARHYQFERIWNEALLKWRLANPLVTYKILKKNKQLFIFSPTKRFGIHAIIGLFKESLFSHYNLNKFVASNPLKIWIGKNPEIDWRSSFYFNMPRVFKPSPLNFIFKDLTASGIRLIPENIKFQIIDFDIF